MNDLIEKENIEIKNMIYEIRGKQVMLDSDFGKLYHVETKRINEAVKNNMEKFPKRFSWKLTEEKSKNFLVENFDQKIWKLVVVDIDVLEFLQNKELPCSQQY